MTTSLLTRTKIADLWPKTTTSHQFEQDLEFMTRSTDYTQYRVFGGILDSAISYVLAKFIVEMEEGG